MRVFISSTFFDLIDIRAELCELLRDIGIEPILSDDKLSGFISHSDRNSIETCWVNVERSDAVIVILNQRYGPKLGANFEDISATHIEYRHAMRKGKRVLFYVRDRLEADYHTRHKNKDKEIVLSWVGQKKSLCWISWLNIENSNQKPRRATGFPLSQARLTLRRPFA